MKITARVFSIITIVLLLLSILLTLGVTVVQKPLLELLYDYPEYTDEFYIPWETLIRAFLWLLCAVILCVGINTEKTGIAFEIIFICLVVLVLPGFSFIWNLLNSFVIRPLLYSHMTATAISRQSTFTLLISYTTLLQPLAPMLFSYLACGISIGRKCTMKSLRKQMESE